jgi:hypothetical protein
MGSIPLPALDVRAPQQQPDPLDSIGKLLALRSLGNQQQIQQQQITAGQQENQQRALQLQDQMTLRSSAKDLDWSQPDTFGKWITNAQQQGVSPQTLSQLTLQRSQYQEQLAKTDTATLAAQKDANSQLQGHIDAIKGVTDPTKRAQVAQAQASQILSGNLIKDPQMQQRVQAIAQGKYIPSDDDLSQMEIGLTDHNTQIEQALKQNQSAEAGATADQKRQESQFYTRTGLGAPGVSSDTVAMSDWLSKNPGKTPSDFKAAMAAQEAAATQPYKLQQAAAEAKTRFLMEGLAKPVYAFNPKDNSTELTDQTTALKNGLIPRPVTQKEISDDVMLNNRLTDVHNKISAYDAALQKPIDPVQQNLIARLLSSDKFKASAFGAEIPVDSLNKALDAENIKNLSPEARDQLIAYYNARESLVGYNRVLSGSGRSNEQALHLQMQTLADPSTTDPDYSRRSIGQFMDNLKIVGQGLPKIPGVQSPDEWQASHPASGVQPSSAPKKPNNDPFAKYGGTSLNLPSQ